MTELALALVLASAVAHASWNLIAKRASGGPVFNWLFDTFSVLVCLPLLALQVLLQPPRLGPTEWLFIVGSAVLHLAYFLLLGAGYRVGDLSLVYPLARGAGPMISTAAAIILLGERPTPLALVGAAMIGLGVIVLTGSPRQLRNGKNGTSIAFALLTGVVIAGYTLWDKEAVTTVAMPPVLYFCLFTAVRAGLLSTYALTRLRTIAQEWKAHRMHALGIAILSPASYILVLYALSMSPVSYVAPAREISIVFGVLLGANMLKESDGKRRMIAALIMLAGITLLALG